MISGTTELLAIVGSPVARVTQQTRRATASGWIGFAPEYYDFFIYAQAAAMVFPQLFFPAGNPKLAIVASLATYGLGYVVWATWRVLSAALSLDGGETRTDASTCSCCACS